jgi:TetR/AcrR family transcriptional regulator, transcriptional repressor for nem operon
MMIIILWEFPCQGAAQSHMLMAIQQPFGGMWKMRYKTGHKAQTHHAIIAAAAIQLRANGIGGVSVGSVMQQAHLTHGGFYEHFASKDALVIETVQEAFASAETLVAQAEAQPPEERLAWFIRNYLSRAHRDHPETGCMLPPLVAEIGRQSETVRIAFGYALEAYFDRLAALLPDGDATVRHDTARYLLASMAGAIALARAIPDPDQSTAVLAATRHALIAQFVK